ncbi:carbon catabolite repressor protein 4 homolog 6-like [Macadamia integrifolia]|uniref:carbon catabolite repressor protein 4 homolog 6-like n=1 Tax=Macadamia integrifolia TaxID=60698 RepID=UPI001C4E633E|nr:carbon catabolite repressor protein 4 homolog 6-like [Macadamia integrifolia]
MRFAASLSFFGFAAATMSSRAPFRGGRCLWRRGFLDWSNENTESFISGDSHFRSVRDANYGFRQRQRGSFGSRGGFPPQNSCHGRLFANHRLLVPGDRSHWITEIGSKL